MNKNKLLRTISQHAVIAAFIFVPIGNANAYMQDAQVETENGITPPPAISITTMENADNDVQETADDDTAEPTTAEEIDAELQAELEAIEERDKLSDPKEILKTFSLKKPLIILPTPDADRLILANRIVARLYPVGTNERTMRSAMDDLIIPMIDRTLELTIAEAIDLFDVPEDLNPLGADLDTEKKIGDLIAETQPDFREKMGVVFEAYAEITGLSSEPIEPALAGAMARDYARKYDMQQLNDLDAFFSTPTGALFAKDFMLSTASIDMVQTALKEFPAIAKNSDAITAASKRIEEAFKTEPTEIEEGDDECDDDACDAVEVVDDGSDEDLGYEPWFDNDNWDETTRSNVNQLEDTYNELAELSEQAYSQYDEAFDAAVAESRAKYIADGWKRDEDE